MTHERLHALTDGIFAIVMTLMVFQIKLPAHSASGSELWHTLRGEGSVFVSYFVSFALLFVYWRAHNFAITIFAKNIDINLLSINGIFLFLVGLVPFTTQLAGSDNTIPLAICLYASNIIAIGLTLLYMRLYIERAETIDNIDRTKAQRRAALIRTLLPVAFAALAMPMSFLSTAGADIILVIGVGFNFLRNAAEIADRLFISPFARLGRAIF